MTSGRVRAIHVCMRGYTKKDSSICLLHNFLVYLFIISMHTSHKRHTWLVRIFAYRWYRECVLYTPSATVLSTSPSIYIRPQFALNSQRINQPPTRRVRPSLPLSLSPSLSQISRTSVRKGVRVRLQETCGCASRHCSAIMVRCQQLQAARRTRIAKQ